MYVCMYAFTHTFVKFTHAFSQVFVKSDSFILKKTNGDFGLDLYNFRVLQLMRG